MGAHQETSHKAGHPTGRGIAAARPTVMNEEALVASRGPFPSDKQGMNNGRIMDGQRGDADVTLFVVYTITYLGQPPCHSYQAAAPVSVGQEPKLSSTIHVKHN